MAIRDAQGLIRGKMGDVVFKVVNGKQVVYPVPKKVKQSVLTKKSAKMFGVCSTQTSILMGKLRPWLMNKVDSGQVNRFRGACLRILKNNEKRGVEAADLDTADMSDLKGFEFNIHSPFTKYFQPEISVVENQDNDVNIKILGYVPAQELEFPKLCGHVDVHILVLHHNFSSNKTLHVLDEHWEVKKSADFEKERQFTFPSMIDSGITLVIVQLLFFKNKSKFGKEYLNDKNCFPAQIVYAR